MLVYVQIVTDAEEVLSAVGRVGVLGEDAGGEVEGALELTSVLICKADLY